MIRLLELRTEKELSQRNMAKLLNISQGTYNNWENGNTQPCIEQLIALAQFFDVTVDYLVGNADEFANATVQKRLNRDEETMLSLYSALPEQAKSAVKTLMSAITEK